jgi:hypothetical protein
MKIKLLLSAVIFFLFSIEIEAKNSEAAIIDAIPLKEEGSIPLTNIKTDNLIELSYSSAYSIFPKLSSKNRPDVADKINVILQQKYLLQLPDHYKDNNAFYYTNTENITCKKLFNAYKIQFLKNNIVQVTINY